MQDETTTPQIPAQDVSALPQWAQDELSQARSEAAKYRVEKKDAVEAAKAEVETEWKSKYETLEQTFNEAKSEVDEGRLEVVKLKAALEAGIDSDKVVTFASLLKGGTEDELKAHADEVKKLFAAPAPESKDPAIDPSQGSGNPLPLNGDPLINSIMRVINK